MSSKTLFFLLINVFLLGTVITEEVKYYPCYTPPGVTPCVIHSVSIDPCKEAKSSKPCEFTIGSKNNGTFTVDFTPNFSATKFLGQAHQTTTTLDIPMVDMDTNACNYASCPIVAGVRNKYSINMPLKEEYPAGAFTVKWKLWNEAEPVKEACCFKFKVILHKN